MSGKITSKNLTYEGKVPKFLAALKGQASASSSSPDPILSAQRRLGLKRSDSTEAEDAPVIVDEAGNTVEAQVDADGIVHRREADAEDDEAAKDTVGQGGEKAGKQGTSGPTAFGRKRKAAKVIGGDDEAGETAREATAEGQAKKNKGEKTEDAKTGKTKKKAKKIKLSFDDDGS